MPVRKKSLALLVLELRFLGRSGRSVVAAATEISLSLLTAPCGFENITPITFRNHMIAQYVQLFTDSIAKNCFGNFLLLRWSRNFLCVWNAYPVQKVIPLGLILSQFSFHFTPRKFKFSHTICSTCSAAIYTGSTAQQFYKVPQVVICDGISI